MSLISRLTTWTAGQVLKAADLNGEFNNLVNLLNNLDSASTAWTNVKVGTLNVTGTSNVIPAGSISAYGGGSSPTGWLLCDGTAVSRSTYAGLFSAIGVSFGRGDNSTTFNVPDFRGRFLRGVDGSAGVDPDKASRTAMNTGGNTGDNVGSVQADGFKSHNHAITDTGHAHTQGVDSFAQSGADHADWLRGSGNGGPTGASTSTTGISLADTGGNETRPVNAYVNFIIKT